MLSRGTISRFYYQGEEAVIRLITKPENRIEDLEAMHVSSPERRIASLSKDLSVPFDNNGSERDLRMVQLMQKITGCFRTSDGARSFYRARSYISTARKQGYSLLLSLERVRGGKPLLVAPESELIT